jgi:acyl-CoA thioesterase
VNVAATAQRSPEETADLAARTMWASDSASRALGMELVAVGPGTATLAMTVTETMTNGHDTAHGGYIFTLADSAFAFACNSYGLVTVAAHCNVTFIRPGKRGDRLVAEAREVSRSGRSGIYDVRVSVDGVVIAEFRGHSRTVGDSFIDPAVKPAEKS